MSFQSINGMVFMDHDDFTTAGAVTNDLDLHSTCVIVIPSNDGDSITGFLGETSISGEMICLYNASGTNSLLLPHDNAGSTDGFRVFTPTGTTLTLAPYESAWLVYIDQVGRAGWWLRKDGTLA